ncbi:hypothetical protein ACHAQE_011072, partial [Botrytis cinerea]
DSDVCSRFRVPGLNSNASRQYTEQVPGEQRHLQEVAAVEDTGKRTVKRNDGTHDVFIEQIIVEDFVPADQWDTENIAIFNLQTVSAAAVEGTIGIKPPQICFEDDDDDDRKNDVESRKVTLGQSGTKARFIPVGERISRLKDTIIVGK